MCLLCVTYFKPFCFQLSWSFYYIKKRKGKKVYYQYRQKINLNFLGKLWKLRTSQPGVWNHRKILLRSSLRGFDTCGFLLVLWRDITQTQKQRLTTHSETNRLPNQQKHILTPPVSFFCETQTIMIEMV